MDFVVSSGRTCIGIEVKAGSRFDERDLTNLGRFAETTRGVSALILAYNGTQAVSLGKKLYAIPIAMLLS